MRKLRAKNGVLLTFEGLSACRDPQTLLSLLRKQGAQAVFLFSREEYQTHGALAETVRHGGWRIALLGEGHGLWSGPIRQWERARIGRAFGEKFGWNFCGYRPAERFLSPFARRCVLRAGWNGELLWNREVLPDGKTAKKSKNAKEKRLVYGGDILRIDCRVWQDEQLLWALDGLFEQMRQYGLFAADLDPVTEKAPKRARRRRKQPETVGE